LGKNKWIRFFKNLEQILKHSNTKGTSSTTNSKIQGFISMMARLAAIDSAMIGQIEILCKLVIKLLANLAA
jgi:hypothetical protein